MHTKKKWLSAVTVAALAIGMGGFIATQANATVVEPEYNEENGCLVTPGVDGYWDEVLVSEAYDETVVVTEAQHYSLKGNSGIEKDQTPVFPADYWQANAHQEPHLAGGGEPATFLEGTSGLHYTSHGSEGLRDWFYFQAEVTDIVHHDAVYEDVWVPEVPPVYGPCGDFPVPALFNAEPEPATCLAAGSFDDGALGGVLIGQDEDGRVYDFADGTIRLVVDTSVAGVVNLYVFSLDDETTLSGLDTTKWTVNADQRSATRTLVLGAQLSGEELCPSDEPTPTPTPTPTDEPSPSPEPTPPNDDDAPPATPVTETPSFTG